MLRFRSLGSGSSGNATVVEAGDGLQVRRLLVDCGFGIRQLATRLGAAGLGIDQIDAIFITHEHADHVGCAHTVAMRHRIPVFMSRGTHVAIGAPDFDGLLQMAHERRCPADDILSIWHAVGGNPRAFVDKTRLRVD